MKLATEVFQNTQYKRFLENFQEYFGAVSEAKAQKTKSAGNNT